VRTTIIVLIGIVAVALLLYYSGFVESFIYGFEGHAGLPSCESSHGQSDAKRAIENAPFAKTLGISIVAISDAKTISANTQKVDCTAMVILNSAKKGVMSYSFTKDPSFSSGQYYAKAELELDTFRPYP